MGNDSSKDINNYNNIHYPKITKNSFEYISIIGKGGFGKVWRVSMKNTRKQYALKEMAKSKIIDKHCEKSVKFECDLLSQINHPFIVNMHFSFQDIDTLYIIMDLLTGGDLRYHLCHQRSFSEEQTKFFISCILLGLEYIHINNIIHRDIKPENLVLDYRGYVKITDFGIAQYHKKDNSNETSGTPGYMAPEVMCRQDHTKAVDYFALGVIGYEFMTGTRPYVGSRKEIKEKIMSKQVQLNKNNIPRHWPMEAAHFINSLLQRKPSKRLGYKGVSEIKEHSWLKYYHWRELYLGKLESPFIPSMFDNYDVQYCNKPDRIGLTTQDRYVNIILSSNYVKAFKDFKYFNREIEEKHFDKSKKMFRNPHDIYYEELTGNTETTDDQTVINRNIFKNKFLEDDEEIKIWNKNNEDIIECINRIGVERSKKKASTLFNIYNLSSKKMNASFANIKYQNNSINNKCSNSCKRTNYIKNDLCINSSYSFKKRKSTLKTNIYYK